MLAYLEKGDLEKQHVCINVCFELEKKYYRIFQSVTSSLWRANNEKNTSFCVVFQVQSSVTPVEDANAQDIQQQVTLMKMWTKGGNLSYTTEKSEVANMSGFSSGSLYIILKDNLKMCLVAAKLISCLLSEQKNM